MEPTREQLREALDAIIAKVGPRVDAVLAEEFIVWDVVMSRYIAGIDQYDGSTTDTPDPAQARIFRGAGWVDFWTSREFGPRFRLYAPPAPDRCPKDVQS